MAGNNSVGSLEKDLLSCDIPDECCLPPKTKNKDNDKDEVCKEKCFDDEELEDDINKARSLSVVGWTVLKRYGRSYDLKKGIVDSYDLSTRFFKVKYRDGTMDTIVERVLLSCLGDPHEMGFPHYLFIEPPVPEGQKPKRWWALRMTARARFPVRTLLKRAARAKGTGKYESNNVEEAEMGGSDDSSEKASVGSNGSQSTGGDDSWEEASVGSNGSQSAGGDDSWEEASVGSNDSWEEASVGSNGSQSAGDDDSWEEASVGSNGSQCAGGDDADPPENSGDVGSSSVK